MADEVRIWETTGADELVEIEHSRLDREERIEKWILKDISVLEPSGSTLLVIGEQVLTAFNKRIDLLCMDGDGNLVIVELKRDRTPREVTAQAIDYASWVKNLGIEEIERIAAEHFGSSKTLREAFEQQFPDAEFPDVLNAAHSIKIVASEIDDSTERIVRYLSESGIGINVVRFHMFRSKTGAEILVRTFTVAPDEAEENARRGSGTKRTRAYKNLDERLSECANAAERDFVKFRITAGQQTNRRRSALVYPVGKRIRWYLRPRPEFAFVIQRGRFAGDEELWVKHLSNPRLSYRRGGGNLGFRLFTKVDFDFFQSTTERGSGFNWDAANVEIDGDDAE